MRVKMEEDKASLVSLLTQVLADYQMIESELRLMVIKKHNLISELVNEWTPFKHKDNDKGIMKKGLGQLIQIYSEMTENKKFIDSLSNIVTKRNDIAHEAFNRIYNGDKEDDLDLKGEIEELVLVKNQIKNCMYLMITETWEASVIEREGKAFLKKYRRGKVN